MSKAAAMLAPDGNPSFSGYPKDLFYLAFTEARERFSYEVKR